MKKKLLTVALSALLLASCSDSVTSLASTETSSETTTETTSETTVETTSEEESESSSAVATSDEDDLIDAIDGTSLVELNDYSDEFKSTELETTYEVDTTVDLSTVTDSYTISVAGTFLFTGSATNVQIIVNVDGEKVHVILDDATITNENIACIYVKAADKVYVTTADGSTNTLTSTGEIADDEDEDLDATIYSKDDLVINGLGTLTLNSEENGITANDDFKVTGGTLYVTADNHGIRANDSIRITLSTLYIDAGKDGLHAENDDLDSYVYVEDGTVYIASVDQAIQASYEFYNAGGTIYIVSQDEGIEAGQINLIGGELNIVAGDDGLNASNKELETLFINIVGGKLDIFAEGDGIDSNGNVYISGGYSKIVQVNESKSLINYDGTMTITGGTLIGVGSKDDFKSNESTVQGTIQTEINSSGDIAVRDADGALIASVFTDESYQMVFVTSPELLLDGTYTIATESTSEEFVLTDLNYNDVTADEVVE